MGDEMTGNRLTATFDRATGECMQIGDHSQNCGGGPDTCGGCAACLDSQALCNPEAWEVRDVTAEEAAALRPKYGWV